MNEFQLTEDQEKALENLKKFINGELDQHLFLLEGAAGTGKTTLLSYLLKWIKQNGKCSNVGMASPTHKALKVLCEMIPSECKNIITFSTLHSMLGLKHEITKDGKEVFVRDKNVMTKFPFYDFVVVDESSMIADDLFNEMQEQNYRNIKVLFVGDGNQINPVNHSESIPMNSEKRKKYNIGYCRLDKIVRQAEDNPIIQYSQKVINNCFSFESGKKEMQNDSGVVMFSESQSKVLHQLLQYYFGSSKFDEDADFCKIIAWRNITVDYYNKIVRSFKYGPTANKIVVGEKLIVDKPIKNDEGDGVLYNTNEDLVVQSSIVKDKKLFDGESWKYYSCDVSGNENNEIIHILHESEQNRYESYLKKLSKSASSESDPGKRRKKWVEYFSFSENFAQVKYNYAITSHNSQGSTYDNCFVVSSDINLNKRDDERKRILYTAMTRPKKMLYII
jgi:hypothetical protein